jgi:hypothetical protein
VTVPAECWNVLVVAPVLPSTTHDEPASVTAGSRVFTVVMPNDQDAFGPTRPSTGPSPRRVHLDDLTPRQAGAPAKRLRRCPATSRGWRAHDPINRDAWDVDKKQRRLVGPAKKKPAGAPAVMHSHTARTVTTQADSYTWYCRCCRRIIPCAARTQPPAPGLTRRRDLKTLFLAQPAATGNVKLAAGAAAVFRQGDVQPPRRGLRRRVG